MAKIQKRTEDGDRLQVYPKGQYELMTAGDPSTALIDMGITSLAGRPPSYTDDEQGLQMFMDRTVDYFRHIKAVNENRETEQMLLPDIESWAVYLQITRATIWNYRKRRGGAWADYIDRVKTLILAQRKDAVSRFKMPPMTYIFDVVNNFEGYYNTSEIKISAEHEAEEKTVDSPETIAARHAGAKMPEPIDLSEI